MKTNDIQLSKYPAYKNSGVEWLGEIPEHWEAVSLGSILELKSDKNHPDYEVLSVYREYGVIKKDSRADNHNATSLDTSNYKAVEPGDLVVNKMKAWQGSMGVSPHKGIVSPAYITCRVNSEKIHPAYLHQLLRCDLYIGEYYRLSYGVRVGQWDMHYEDFKHITTTIPPIAEQTAIANFLDNKTALIDKAIALKQKQIELLKERRQILIHRAVTRGLNPDAKLKDSGVEWIGEIPEGWEVKRLKYVAEMISIKILSKGSSLKYIGMENIESWSGNHISSETETEGLASYFKKGDILFGKLRPYLAKVYLAKEEGICSTEFLVFRNCNELSNDYLHSLLLSFGFINLVDSSTYGSKMPRASSDFIVNQLIPIPNKIEQKAILDYIESLKIKISTAISLKEKEIEKLKEYKSVLINEAVSGKIKVN